MEDGWRLFGLFAAIFAAALGLERGLVPEVVPPGLADLPQPLWAIGMAFTLRALELMSGSIALIALLVMSGAWAHQLHEARADWGAVLSRLKAAVPGLRVTSRRPSSGSIE